MLIVKPFHTVCSTFHSQCNLLQRLCGGLNMICIWDAGHFKTQDMAGRSKLFEVDQEYVG